MPVDISKIEQVLIHDVGQERWYDETVCLPAPARDDAMHSTTVLVVDMESPSKIVRESNVEFFTDLKNVDAFYSWRGAKVTHWRFMPNPPNM
ncbi:hypothetical protein [Ralstonia phage RSP15]|uniref:hypothetical protein n=1 Tax=Ralstonia phage RSP15 TaxID=1785960 RepID=UPI00074D3695|nr:hypothetical protein BH754_gp133 [Ralstonia phage RSP15]BAU40173.1 hypothetical protein [Ralstonia phage RSP15]